MRAKTPSTELAPVRFGREEPYDFSCLEELFDSRYAPEPCRTIHLGCETGRISVFIAQKGYQVLGIDPDRDCLAAARERAVMAAVEMDLMAGDPLALPPLPEECFGLAVDLETAGSLEDGYEREEYLRKLHRLLTRTGVLLSSAPAPRRKSRSRKRRPFAFSGPFVSDFTRAGFEVMKEKIASAPDGEKRLLVHARKPQ
ncbi:MAG: class I SAM-dependent methyltransferase [Planctomycetota bacterium]|jgi:SAM-dependent methyltransferase